MACVKAAHTNIAFFIPHRGCPHRCSFCDQRAISGEGHFLTPEAVGEQLKAAFSRDLNPESTEIAFFGGSFTCLPQREMEGFLQAAFPYVQSGKCRGIRVSTRPDGISKPILDLLSRYGVTAIELGAQSLDDKVLQINGRGHTAEDVRTAAEEIRRYPGNPFSLGLQIMTGLPGEDEQSRELTQKAALSIRPDTLRLYPTVVIRGTELARWMEEGHYRPPDLEETVAFAAPMLERYEKAGIRIIRAGLHASRELEAEMLGGAYHPAFRELCQSELFRQKLEKSLAGQPKGKGILTVHPRFVSIAVGQKRKNLLWAEKQGYSLKIRTDETLEPGEFTLDFEN